LKLNRLTKSFILLVLSSLLLLFSSSCKEEQKNFKPLEITFKKEGELSLFKAETDSLIAKYNIEIAETDYERQRGLMDRKSMKDDQAMLFIFPDMRMRSFYMKNTYIALDIIYIDDSNKIVSIQKNAKPLNEASLPSTAPAKYVLEINGGLSDQLGIEEGDSIEFNKTTN
jgi:uncharacterized membrane protein (UPF0127 family)